VGDNTSRSLLLPVAVLVRVNFLDVIVLSFNTAKRVTLQRDNQGSGDSSTAIRTAHGRLRRAGKTRSGKNH